MKLDIRWEMADKPDNRKVKRKWPKAYVGEKLVAFLQPIDGRGFKPKEAHDLEIIVWVCDYSEDGIGGYKGRKLHRKADGLDDAAEMVFDFFKRNRKALP